MTPQQAKNERIINRFKNTKKQGCAGLGVAISWFTVMGYTVSIPLNDSQDYDLLVEIEERIVKIQVKMTFFQVNGKYQVNLSVKGGNRSSIGKLKVFNPQSCDYIFILTGKGTKYLIPTLQIKPRHHLILNYKYDRFIVQLDSF